MISYDPESNLMLCRTCVFLPVSGLKDCLMGVVISQILDSLLGIQIYSNLNYVYIIDQLIVLFDKINRQIKVIIMDRQKRVSWVDLVV